MKKIIIQVCILVSVITSFAQDQKISVFVSGQEGYKSFRIPAIIKASNNDLLAFCEGRVNSSGDFGDIDIIMKRSKDNGTTWSNISVVANFDSLQAGNPAPVVDYTDPAFPNGKIFLFFNTGNNHEGEVRKGKGVREVWYKTSVDNGITWSEAVNITTQTHRPNQPKFNIAYTYNEDWRSYANTPGHALQISSGKYKGRMYIAANHSEGAPKKGFEDYFAHGYYTDDHGKTFHISASINVPGSNESTAAELSNNRLMQNIRNQNGSIKSRLIAISNDGGAKWDSIYFDENLPDPVCEGSILNIGFKKGQQILAFINAASKTKRDNLTLRISFDEGKTWKKSVVIDKSDDEKSESFTAYSDIVLMKKNQIGILYEKENYSKIVFTIRNWKRL